MARIAGGEDPCGGRKMAPAGRQVVHAMPRSPACGAPPVRARWQRVRTGARTLRVRESAIRRPPGETGRALGGAIRPGLLPRRQDRLPPEPPVAAIMRAVALAPGPDRLRTPRCIRQAPFRPRRWPGSRPAVRASDRPVQMDRLSARSSEGPPGPILPPTAQGAGEAATIGDVTRDSARLHETAPSGPIAPTGIQPFPEGSPSPDRSPECRSASS